MTSAGSTQIRVLHFIATLGRGGAETMLLQLLKSLSASTFRHEVIVLEEGGALAPEFRSAGIPVHELRLRQSFPRLWDLFRLPSIIRTFQPHRLCGWMYHGNILASVVNMFLNSSLPVLWNIRAADALSERLPLLTRLLIRIGSRISSTPEAIIYNSHAGEKYHRRLGFDPRLSTVIWNGFDLNRFKPDPHQRARIRSELKIPETARVIGFIGRVHPHKDHPTFVESFCQIARRRPDLFAVLAGDGVSPENPVFRPFSSDPALTDRVRLLGPRSDVPAIINALDLGCLSSVSEAFPNTVGEYMACGVPTVVTDTGDTRQIIGVLGKLVPPRDPRQFSIAIEALIDELDSDASVVKAACRERIENLFGLERTVTSFAKLLGCTAPRERSGVTDFTTSVPKEAS